MTVRAESPAKGRSRKAPQAEGEAAAVAAVRSGGPWFESQTAALHRFVQADRPAHAVLVHGMTGIGKGQVAHALVRVILCENGEPAAAIAGTCRCRSCTWVDEGRHPDVRMLSLLERDTGKMAREISIDQVRELDEFTSKTSWRGNGAGARVVLIDPAETLSNEASNALLKILEEPGALTFFVLVTHRPDRLPATVRSRTRALLVPPPATQQAVDWLVDRTGCEPAQAARWLGMSGGAVVHALALADPARDAACQTLVAAIAEVPDTSLLVVADRVVATQVDPWLPWLLRWIGDLVRVAAGAAPHSFPGEQRRLETLASRAGPWRLSVAAERLQQQSVLADHPLNPRLFVEGTLAIYRDAFG